MRRLTTALALSVALLVGLLASPASAARNTGGNVVQGNLIGTDLFADLKDEAARIGARVRELRRLTAGALPPLTPIRKVGAGSLILPLLNRVGDFDGDGRIELPSFPGPTATPPPPPPPPRSPASGNQVLGNLIGADATGMLLPAIQKVRDAANRSSAVLPVPVLPKAPGLGFEVDVPYPRALGTPPRRTFQLTGLTVEVSPVAVANGQKMKLKGVVT